MRYTSTRSLFNQIRNEIKPIYGDEADTLAMFIVEDVSGFSSTDILTDHKFQTGPSFKSTILKYIVQLKKQEPIQYILGKAFFYENIYEVNEDTLIPRPETEELVRLALDYMDSNNSKFVLDIGTGTGCIAITLALNNSKAVVEAMDISLSALKVAERNAQKLKTDITFIHADILSFEANKEYDLIISNPPYVRESEKLSMSINVLDHEPGIALFVDDDDPLIFYRNITDFCDKGLKPGGSVFYEVNDHFATAIVTMLRTSGFNKVEVVKDLNGKDRFVYGVKGI